MHNSRLRAVRDALLDGASLFAEVHEHAIKPLEKAGREPATWYSSMVFEYMYGLRPL